MILNMPCYRTNGTLWFEEHTPTAGCVAYSVSLWNYDWRRVQGVSDEIRDALANYHETMISLLRAGF